MPRHIKSESFDRRHSDGGNAIGLTQAFSPIDDEDFEGGASEGLFTGEPLPEADVSDAPGSSSELPDPPVGVDPIGKDDVERAKKRRARHARHAAPTSGEGRSEQKIPEYMRKSRRMRRILIGVIVVLLLALAAGGVFVWRYMQVDHAAVVQQQNTSAESQGFGEEEAKDVPTATAKITTVPDLVSLLGLTQDEVVEALQHGAQVSTTREVNEEGNPIKTEARVILTAEPSDSRSGAPTVYLGLDEEGAVIQAGYSASTSSLGYGSLSFSDAVLNEGIVEKTLTEAGLPVEKGAVELPADKAEYSTYDTDGTTLTKEYCSFAGDADLQGTVYSWSAVLSYDYALANATGNLADTVRTVYVYIGV